MDRFVLYWMQQSQRVHYNKALNSAIEFANKLDIPLIVCFVTTDFPDATSEHYNFMIDGIKEVISELIKKRIGFVLKRGDIINEITTLANESEFLFMDRGYLAIQRKWRNAISSKIVCDFKIIDSDTIIPVTVASDKQEIAARTLRFKINKLLPEHLLPFNEISLNNSSLKHELVVKNKPVAIEIIEKYSRTIQKFAGGGKTAQKLLNSFINTKLPTYHTSSSDPSLDVCSRMSPYLHFGNISPLDIALQIKASSAPEEAKEAYLEQLIVRRELAVNFVWFTKGYNQYEQAVPEWAQESLHKHSNDKREYLYSYSALENADTHDPYWNAAQKQMLTTGFMHNYMRMYWAKKIIEWTKDPETAYYWALKLNNSYQFDGRDANSFTGVAWTFGRHDHPWREREVFGKVRYMNNKGLERKFKIKIYADKWNDKP